MRAKALPRNLPWSNQRGGIRDEASANLQTVMKMKRLFIGFLLSAVLLANPVTRSAVGGAVSFSYDSAGRLLSANYGGGQTASFAYDASGNILLSSAPAPAIIATPLAGRQLTLSWPVSPPGFVLQTSPALGPAESWSDVVFVQQPVQVGNLMVATFAIGPHTAFYRLRH
jgi:YD repeat-containing protein